LSTPAYNKTYIIEWIGNTFRVPNFSRARELFIKV